MNRNELYEGMIFEMEEFLSELYEERQELLDSLTGSTLQDVLDEKKEIEDYLDSLNSVIENVENSMFVVKAIAFSRYDIVLFNNQEKEFVNDVSEETFGEEVFNIIKNKVS